MNSDTGVSYGSFWLPEDGDGRLCNTCQEMIFGRMWTLNTSIEDQGTHYNELPVSLCQSCYAFHHGDERIE